MQRSNWRLVADRFKDYIRPERWLIADSLLSLLAATFVRLLKPLPLAFAADYILIEVMEHTGKMDDGRSPAVRNIKLGTSLFEVSLQSIDKQYLLLGCGIAVVLITLLMAAGNFLDTVGLSLTGSRILAKVRSDLFVRLLSLSMGFHSQAKNGDLTMRLISDVTMLREAVVTALMPMLTNIFALSGMLIVMFYSDWRLTFFAITSLPFLQFMTSRSDRRIHEVNHAQREKEGGLALKASEYIASIKTIQSLSLENETIRNFEGNSDQSRMQEVKSKRPAADLEHCVDLLMTAVTTVVLSKNTSDVLGGQMSTDELIVFMSYLNNSFRPVYEYAKYTARLSKALAAGERIINPMDQQSDIKDRPSVKTPTDVRSEIHFDHVGFGYQGKDKNFVSVLKGMDFKINPGENVAIFGPFGSSRTIIANPMLRLYESDSEIICIGGRNIQKYTIAGLRKRIAIVPQENLLFGVSIRDDTILGTLHNTGELTHTEIIVVAKLANAHDLISVLPDGYNTVLSELGSSLSGGQRQRIVVARAAISRSSILLLDEPTMGLDRENESHIISVLHNLTKSHTTIMITHDLAFAATADRIIFIKGGVVMGQGSHEELLALGQSYAD